MEEQSWIDSRGTTLTTSVLTHPSWSQIEKGCAFLAFKLARLEFSLPNRIIAISRGGLIPGVIISHILNVPITPINYSSLQGKGEYKQHDNVLPNIKEPLLLIIDDIADSGKTLNEIVTHYNYTEHKVVRTAILFFKVGSIITPDYYWQTIPADAPWIVFPWE